MPPRKVPEQLPISAALRKSVIINRIDQPNQVPWTEWRVPVASGCPADPYSVVMTGATGKIDPCLLPTTSGLLIEVGGVAVPDQSVLNFIAQTGIAITYDAFGGIYIANTGASSTSFTDITSGVNTQAVMVVGTGASLGYSGTGIVDANEIGTINVAGNLPTHAGMVLVSQPGNTAALWADPQVQGLYAAGSDIASPPPYTPPTTIQPVLVGGEDQNGKLQNIATTTSGVTIALTQDQETDVNVLRFAATTGKTFVTNTTPTLLPALSIRPKVGATSVTFTFRNLHFLSKGNLTHFQLLLNATLTGASFVNVDPASNAQYDVSAASYTGGRMLDAGYVGADSRHNDYEFRFGFTGGNPDIITLVFVPITGSNTSSAGTSFAWDEQAAAL